MDASLADLPLIASGKVRDIYDLGDRLLLVASDRISTYDAVHPTPIPDKGAVLTGLSAFWFEQTASIVPNHMISVSDGVPAEARGRGMVVRKLTMLPVECVVRGYLSGSGWKDYQATGAVSGIPLPAGLRRVREAAGADLHAVDEGGRRPRRGDRFRRRHRPGGRSGDGGARPRRVAVRLPAAAPSTRAPAGSSSPTRSSSSVSTRTAR